MSIPSAATPDTRRCEGRRDLITHSHYDHLDVAAVEAIQTPQTEILCDRTSAEAFEMNCYTMRPGSVAAPRDYLKVEAVAAYNTTDGTCNSTPKTARTAAISLPSAHAHLHRRRYGAYARNESLKNIDIAFLPVNQPYTMTVDQAVEAVKAIRPAVFYPYHYGEVEEKTDTAPSRPRAGRRHRSPYTADGIGRAITRTADKKGGPQVLPFQ